MSHAFYIKPLSDFFPISLTVTTAATMHQQYIILFTFKILIVLWLICDLVLVESKEKTKRDIHRIILKSRRAPRSHHSPRNHHHNHHNHEHKDNDHRHGHHKHHHHDDSDESDHSYEDNSRYHSNEDTSTYKVIYEGDLSLIEGNL